MTFSESSDHSPLNACQNLSRIREDHCKEFGSQDAFCVFLGIHECIAEAVVRSGSNGIKRLNSHFANRCVDAYQRFRRHEGRDFEELWGYALDGYLDAPNDLAQRLPFMAAAHIIEDLPTAIYDSYPLDEDEYNSVFVHIVYCLEMARTSNRISFKAWQEILRQFKRKAPLTTSFVRTILAVGIAIAWLPPLLNPGVRTMRSVAWKIAQNKNKISNRT